MRLWYGSGNRAPASQGPMEYCVYLDLCTDLNQRRNPAGDYSHFDGPASVHVERMKCNSDGPLLAGVVRSRTAACGKRTSNGGFPATNRVRCRSQTDPLLPLSF